MSGESVAAERDCLAMAVLFALQWTPEAPMGLRDGIEEILATGPRADEGEQSAALLAKVKRLSSELAKYVGHEPTLAEEARYAHEQELRARIAQDVNRADRPTFAAGEDPELVVKTTRAIDIRLIQMGDQAPYWVPQPEAGDPR